MAGWLRPDGPRSEGAVPLQADPVDGIAGDHAHAVLAVRALDGICIAVLIATAVQLVSPWNEAAALTRSMCGRRKSKNERSRSSELSCRWRVERGNSTLPREQVPRILSADRHGCPLRDWTPMKRLILLIVVVMLVYWVLARHRSRSCGRPAPGHRNGPHYAHGP